jgi:putative transposase
MKLRFTIIRALRHRYLLRDLCAFLHVSRSGFYRWNTRNCSASLHREAHQRHLIRTVHREHGSVYGIRKLYHVLHMRGVPIGRNRVAQLMRKEGICGRWKPRRRPKSICARDARYTNIVQRQFTTARPNLVWLTDFTYIPVRHGTLYLAVVLDLYARRVVGWATSPVRAEVAREAVRRAFIRRPIHPGLVVHSDRGSEYTGSAMAQLVLAHGGTQSFSAVGECYDNAPIESFFHVLKAEIGTLTHMGFGRAHHEIARYIEQFYNPVRIHSANGYRSPAHAEAVYYSGTA